MAKRNSTRRKARKPKFFEIEGHRLTEAMHADYERCVERRSTTMSPGNDANRILELGLGDFLGGYRPSRKIKEQIANITQVAIDTSLAIGAMERYPWYTAADSAHVCAAGVELVKKLALDLYYASAKLTAVAANVEAEKRTKLQDWLVGDERVARIGRGVEVAHV